MENLTEAQRKSQALIEWELEQKRIDQIKAKAYGRVKNANQRANEYKAFRNRVAKRRRKSR